MIKILLSIFVLLNFSITILDAQPQGQVIWSRQGTGGIYAAFPTYDYNNDGIADVVAAAYYGAYPSPPIRLFLVSGSDGSAIWTRSDCQGVWGNRGLSTISDISGDSIPDIIMGTPGGIFPGRTVFAINGVTNATLWSKSYYPDAGWVYSVRPTVDINNDGYPEVLAGVGGVSTTGNRGVAQCFCGHTGDSLWAFKPYDAVMCIFPHYDINNDTVPEVIFGAGGNGYDNKIYCLNGRTGAQIWSYNTGGSVEYVIGIDDINGNGVPDVVGGGWAYKVVCVDGLTGSLLWQNTLGSPRVIYDLRRIRDINNDGYDDIVVGSWSNQVTVLSGLTGAILWSQTVGGDCWNVDTLPDMTGDGIPEVVAGAVNGRNVMVLNGANGNIIWQYNFIDRVYDVACGADFDNDGYVDVLVSLQDQNSQPYQLYALKGFVAGIEEENMSAFVPKIKVIQLKDRARIKLSVPVGKKFQAGLYDLGGRRVEKTPATIARNETNYIEFIKDTKPAGIYFVRIEIEDYKTETVKITLF
ncbi:MAG: PQQ-binding-like beta-propeller repeat protein [Candidatus Latescibacteria bacterium]|nr:PQQ-binding-like beta-propeller repeat protein [Candidatus Latescibacterota bacterium]